MSEPVYESRVYVGNVDFCVTPEELTDFFEGLSVQSTEIPSKPIVRRGKNFDKRLGFAFVQFATEEDADKAVELYKDREFKLRTVYIKKALPPVSEEEKQAKKDAYNLKRKEAKKKLKAEARAKAAESKAEENKKSEAKKSPESKVPEGTKSKDTIFITNLDYKANSKSLGALFKDYETVWVSVPTRRVPPFVLKKFAENKKPIFNKGFAFVKFSSEDAQAKAIAEFNGKEYNERVLVVEAAVERPEAAVESPDAAAESPDAEDAGSEPAQAAP